MQKPDSSTAARKTDILRHEFVGLHVDVAWSSNPDAVGLSGRVVDETRNMLVIRTDAGTGDKDAGGRAAAGKTKSLPKKDCSFIFMLPGGERVKVDGGLLVARPEDRIKKKQKAW